MSIMYVCAGCEETAAELCAYSDRNDLRVMPTGEWLCKSCFAEWPFRLGEDEFKPSWCDLPPPPEYVEALAPTPSPIGAAS